MNNLAEELRTRGLIEHEGGGKAADFLKDKRTVYLGMDPTADSLHVGHLVPLIVMKHLANAGHELVFLVGGGTGMIGDPRESGERKLLDAKTLALNTKALHKQLTRILGKKYRIVDNYDWLKKLGMIEFLRDVGKHFTVNQLIKRDIIKRRLDTEEDAISYTEFSYSLLQAYDFLHLYTKYGVDLQIGGSDQWANIVSCVDLIRRRAQGSAYALTTPIIEDAKTGKKFGKSEGNAVWLSAEKTSAYDFYQFWLTVPDESVEKYLKIFTFLSFAEIDTTMSAQRGRPQDREGQKTLAFEVTKMIHGEEEGSAVQKVSGILFGDTPFSQLGKDDLRLIARSISPVPVSEGMLVADALALGGIADSKTDARRLIEGKAVSLNDALVETIDRTLLRNDFRNNYAFLCRGKKIALLRR